jgi:hypothetical protein
MSRPYLRGELELMVAPTLTDLLQDNELFKAHSSDVTKAHPWLSITLATLATEPETASRALVEETKPEERRIFGEYRTEKKMLTLRIEIASHLVMSVPLHFHFMETEPGSGFYTLHGQT